MKVHITNHGNDTERLFEGTPEHVLSLILFHYPFLRKHHPDDDKSLAAALEHLDTTGYYQVDVEHDEPTEEHSDNEHIESEMIDGP